MMRNTPLRRMILQFSHLGLMEALIFIGLTFFENTYYL